MRKYGLIGFPLTHSFSAKYFAEKFEKEGITDAQYNNYPLESIEELPGLIKSENLSGFNITIPYKEAVIEYLDVIGDVAEAIGAVNCVKISDGKLKGYNTDEFGFRESLKKFIGENKVKALVLGTGGSSKAISHALKALAIPFTFVSRRKKAEWFTYHELTPAIIADHKLIINTSPIGMFPNVDVCPDIPYEYLTRDHFLYDLLYNPAETLFLRKGEEKGAQVKNGLEMLHLQAIRNWEIWNG